MRNIINKLSQVITLIKIVKFIKIIVRLILNKYLVALKIEILDIQVTS